MGFFGQGRGGIKAVNHEETHEHCGEEGRQRHVNAAAIGDHRDVLVTVHDQHDDCEDHHANNLKEDAGVIDERDQAQAEYVEHGNDDERDCGDPNLVVQRTCINVPAHVVEGGQNRERQRHDYSSNGEDAGEDVYPTREPRVGSPS
jgi:hypothetical protein